MFLEQWYQIQEYKGQSLKSPYDAPDDVIMIKVVSFHVLYPIGFQYKVPLKLSYAEYGCWKFSKTGLIFHLNWL